MNRDELLKKAPDHPVARMQAKRELLEQTRQANKERNKVTNLSMADKRSIIKNVWGNAQDWSNVVDDLSNHKVDAIFNAMLNAGMVKDQEHIKKENK